jgi:hypothetical protein
LEDGEGGGRDFFGENDLQKNDLCVRFCWLWVGVPPPP